MTDEKEKPPAEAKAARGGLARAYRPDNHGDAAVVEEEGAGDGA